MSFNFDYSYKKAMRSTTPREKEPIAKIYNNLGRKDTKGDYSYIFLNKEAVKLLSGNGRLEKVRIGIDTETQKIVIIPEEREGRNISISTSGSAQLWVSGLINENKIPTQTCVVRAYGTYAKGGIILDYVSK